MGQRNMVYSGPMIDTELEHARLRPEPSVMPYGQMTGFRQPNDHLPPPGNIHGPLPYGITRYHSVDSNTFMAAPPPGVRVVPVPITPGLQNQLPFQVMDGFNGAFKGKITGGFPMNFQYFYPAPGSGSSSFMLPEYTGYEVIPVVMGPGHHRGGRNRATGAIGLDHPGLQFMPLTHGAQPLQMVPAPWFDQQFRGSAPGMPYMQGYTNGYQVMAPNRNLVAFVHPPVASHPPPPPMPPLRGNHNMDFYPQLASTSRMVPLQNGVELVPRFVGPTPPIGVRMYPPRHQELMVESTSRPRRFPRLRVLPEDGVAMLEFPNYGHGADHHREMRLDIDSMSYEDLIALGEQIGVVGSRLSDGFIVGHLKTRTFTSSRPEDVPSADEELSFCTICQMEYEGGEKIGILDCKHEYHVECIKKWLVVKNNCPVCKCTALATQSGEA